MNRISSFCISLSWIAFVLGSASAQDDDRPSHDFGNRTLSPKNISKFLEERRNQAGGAGFNMGLMKKLMQNFGDVIDPGMIDPEMVRKFVEDNPEFRDPKNLERLKDFVEKQVKDNPEQWDPKKIQEAIKRVEDLQLKNKDLLDPKKENPNIQPPKELPKPPQEENKEKPKDDRRVNEMKRWMKKNFGESTAMKNLSKQFSDRLKRANNRKLDWLPTMKKDWLPSGDWFKRKKNNTSKSSDNNTSSSSSKLPDIGSGFKVPDRPRITTSTGDNSFFSSSGSSGRSGVGESGFGWMSLVVLCAIGFAVWYYYLRPVKAPPAVLTELPPPPVDLSNLATREDVILAFEYLSVTKCGSEARNWHHNEIAEKMGELTDHDAAAGLARLYEKARYAPTNELFTDADLAAARQNVRLLAPEGADVMMSQHSVYQPGRCLIVMLAWFCLSTSAIHAQEDDDDRPTVPANGTEAFRLMLYKFDLDPLEQISDINTDPAKTIIILFGEESVRKYLNDNVERAVRHGAALLIATDRNTNRTPLRRLFGVEVTGDTVKVDLKDGYENQPFWPFVRPKGVPWLAVAKDSPLEFFNKLEPSGMKGLATSNTSVAKRTWLDAQNGQMTPLEGIAGYPRSAVTLRHGKLDPNKDYFAIGGKWGDGQVLVLADHSPFYNFLFLAEPPQADENANAGFSSDLVRWLQTSDKEPRTRCVFADEGKIRTDFDLMPDLPFNEKFNFAVEIMNESIPDLQKHNSFNEFVLGILDAENITVRAVLRAIIVGLSIFFLLYCFLRMIRSRVKFDPARTLVTHEVAAMIPKGGVLRQRFDAQLDVDNLYEMARERIREEFTPLKGEPDPQGHPPVVKIDATYGDARSLRKKILRLWEIGYGTRPVKVSTDYWYDVLDQLDEVLKHYDDRWWSFEPPIQ